MFIRIAWHKPRPPSSPRTLRRIVLAGQRDCDDLGIPTTDFCRMTRGLFDRQG